MSARLSIVAGLVVGVLVAGVVLGGILALAPARPLPTIVTPTFPLASAVPSVPPSSIAPSARPSPTAGASDAAFHIGQPARDGALSGIGPDVMVSGLKGILPGVDVTP